MVSIENGRLRPIIKKMSDLNGNTGFGWNRRLREFVYSSQVAVGASLCFIYGIKRERKREFYIHSVFIYFVFVRCFVAVVAYISRIRISLN